jgi:hypothetical protein
MKTSTALLLAAGTCGAGFLAGWLVFRSDGTCKVELPPTQPLQRAEAPEGSRAALDGATDLEKLRLVIQSAPVEPTAAPAQVVATTPPPDPRNLPESTIEEMYAKWDAVQAIMNNLKRPIIKHRLQEGLFDHVSDDPNWRPPQSDWDRSVISSFRSGAKGCDRATLPRNQYPEVYVYYDETLRLEDLIYETVRLRLPNGK